MGYFTAVFGGKMRVKDLLAEVALIVEGNELYDKILSGNVQNDATAEEKLHILINCYNAVLRDVATNYLAYTQAEAVSSNSMDVTNSKFTFIKLVSVTDAKGNPIPYTKKGNIIKVKENGFTYVYTTVPKEQGLDDEFLYQDKIIGKYPFIYGTLAEYCLTVGRLEDAENWESKFRQSVEIRTDYKNRKIKAGKRWGL